MADSTLKPELLRRYAGDRRIFVETGTSKGNGLQNAIEHGFAKLFSIEANLDTFFKASQRFADNKNVQLLLGDGGQTLKSLLRCIDEPAVFWLDSHWSTGEAPLAQGVSQCPLLKELQAIAEHPIKDHVILIDDIRYFWKGIPQWGGITVAQIVEKVVEINPLYWIRFEHGVTPADIMVATMDPSSAKVREAV